MKKILGIVASPRKLGNCEIMVKEIGRRISVPHRLRLLRLSDFKVQPCRGCYTCLFDHGRCVLSDDLSAIVQAIVNADALIVAVPAYFLGANAVLKSLLDRGLVFYPQIEALWGKPSVGVAIAGIPGKEGSTLIEIDRFLKLLFTCKKKTRIAYGALPGEIFLNDGNHEIAAELAAALFGSPETTTHPHCSHCGGDAFRFLDRNQVHCLLCGTRGALNMKAGETLFSMDPDEHPLFHTKEDALAHRKWLVDMKTRFLNLKKRSEKGHPLLSPWWRLDISRPAGGLPPIGVDGRQEPLKFAAILPIPLHNKTSSLTIQFREFTNICLTDRGGLLWKGAIRARSVDG